MINSIELKNFQSHIDSKLEFGKGINIIVGTSDSGKSSILRALNLVINNRPSGDSFINYDFDSAEVKLNINENQIVRKKSKKENKYIVNDKELKAFNTDVPDEIKHITNFSELNLQKQFDQHFLISESSGEVARFLNRIINLDVIDKSLSNIESNKRQVKRGIENNTELAEVFKKDIENYSWLSKAQNLLDKIEELESEKEELESVILYLTEKEENYHYYTGKIQRAEVKLKSEKLVKELESDIILVEDINSNINILSNSIQKIEDCENKNNKLLKLIKSKEMIKEIEQEIIDWNGIDETIAYLNSGIDCYCEIADLDNILRRMKVELKEIIPDVCPTCGQEIKDKENLCQQV